MSPEMPTVRGAFWSSIPRRVRLLIFTQVLNAFGFGYFIIYLTAYLPEVGTAGAYAVGIILGVESAVLVVAGIPLGLLSDRRGRKHILVVGNLLLAPALMIFAVATDFRLFLIGAVIAGVGESASLSTWNAIIADQTDLTNRDAAFSLSFIVSNAFFSLGMALPFFFPALQMILKVGTADIHTGSLLFFGVASFLPPLFIWVLLRHYNERSTAKETDKGREDLGLLLKFSGMNGIIGLGAGLIIPLMGTWLLLKFAVPDTYSGPFLALCGMTIAFAAVGSSRLSARFGLLRAILMTAGSSTFFMLSLAFIPNVFLAGGVYMVRAALMNMSAPLIDSYLMGIAPKMRGLASAIAAIVWRLPNGVSTIVGGYLLAAGFYDLPWLGASLLYVLGIILLYTNFKNVKPKE